VVPKTIVRLFNLSQEALQTFDKKTYAEAQKIQGLVCPADWTKYVGNGGDDIDLDVACLHSKLILRVGTVVNPALLASSMLSTPISVRWEELRAARFRPLERRPRNRSTLDYVR
jgi:hypothetical protein